MGGAAVRISSTSRTHTLRKDHNRVATALLAKACMGPCGDVESRRWARGSTISLHVSCACMSGLVLCYRQAGRAGNCRALKICLRARGGSLVSPPLGSAPIFVGIRAV